MNRDRFIVDRRGSYWVVVDRRASAIIQSFERDEEPKAQELAADLNRLESERAAK